MQRVNNKAHFKMKYEVAIRHLIPVDSLENSVTKSI